jgi:isopentenyl diphosphate isomerase/L-lactate dehydrogenase-like FMN-dependent dehydrogenase
MSVRTVATPVTALQTMDAIIERARQNLSPELWDYVAGGAESETTLRRNRAGFDRIGFRPRLLSSVLGRHTRTSFLGVDLALPVMFAPVGSIARYHPDGVAAAARVGEQLGTMTFVSSSAQPSLEAVREQVAGPLVFQIYVRGDREWLAERVRRAEAAGCAGLCVTADFIVQGRRDRNRDKDDFKAIVHDSAELQHQETFTWEEFAWLRSITPMPLILKGITHAGDARLAVEHGADVVHVSNHGGRQLDHLPGAIEVLQEITEAVGGDADVIVDSGFVRGSDVVKALALGAKAVLVGKLMVWGLAAGGEEGLHRVMQLMGEEILDCMSLVGVRTVDQLDAGYVRPVTPPGDSSWVGFAPPAS